MKGIGSILMKNRGIPVTGTHPSGRTKRKGPDSTTTLAVALILGLARNIAADDASVKSGGWQTGLAIGLSGKKLGLVGLGKLGGAVGKIMYQSFGMEVLAWRSNLTQEKADEKAKELGLDGDGEKIFRVVGKEELFRESDVISVHMVLSDRSRGIIGEKELGVMKKSALLVNTSRGPLIDEGSLVEALEGRKIGGVALDVFEKEPLPLDSVWRRKDWGSVKVLVTPHMGYVEEVCTSTLFALSPARQIFALL